MPQLDVLSFSSEIIWFLLLFFSSFFLFVLYLLPNVYVVLRTRERRRYSLANSSKSAEVNSKLLGSYSGKSPLNLVGPSTSATVNLDPRNSAEASYSFFNLALNKVKEQNTLFTSELIAGYYLFLLSNEEDFLGYESFILDYTSEPVEPEV